MGLLISQIYFCLLHKIFVYLHIYPYSLLCTTWRLFLVSTKVFYSDLLCEMKRILTNSIEWGFENKINAEVTSGTERDPVSLVRQTAAGVFEIKNNSKSVTTYHLKIKWNFIENKLKIKVTCLLTVLPLLPSLFFHRLWSQKRWCMYLSIQVFHWTPQTTKFDINSVHMFVFD